MANFNLENYEPVHERLIRFRKDHPDARILPELVVTSPDLNTVIMKTTIYKNADEFKAGVVWTVDFAEETRGQGPVNKTSHVENCSTSATGRALANIGYHGDKRPSREEMEKAGRNISAAPAPAKPAGKIAIFREFADKATTIETADKLARWCDERSWTDAELKEIVEKMKEIGGLLKVVDKFDGKVIE